MAGAARRHPKLRAPVIRSSGYPILLLAALGGALGCTSDEATEPYVPSTVGGTQPEGNGVFVDARSACETLVYAEDDARARLGCGEPPARPACPDYLSPNGGPCALVDQGSLQSCVEQLEAYTACDDFERHPCYLTATFPADASACSGGAAGAPSPAGGQTGLAGAGGQAGAGGA